MGDAEIGVDDGLVGAHFGRRAVGDLAAVVEHRDAVGQAHHHADVVLDQHDRRAEPVARGANELPPSRRFSVAVMPAIGSSSRMILGCGHERAGEFDALLQAVGQRADQAILHRVEFDKRDRFQCPLPGFVRLRGRAAKPNDLLDEGGMRRAGKADATLSSTLKFGTSARFWNVRATPSRGSRAVGTRVNAWPPIRTRPLSGR